MNDTVVVLTGATSGIGLAAARRFATDTGHLIVHGRQPEEKVAMILDELRLTMPPQARLHYVQGDFSSLGDVNQLAHDVIGVTGRVDVLVNNAGQAGPPRRTTTGDGHEVTFQVNYLAHVALTTLLQPLLGAAKVSRIVNVASTTHYSARLDLDDLELRHHRYDAYDVYANSKLAMVAWSCWLAAHRPHAHLEVVSMHPGVIATKVLGSMFSSRGARPEVGGRNVRFVADQRGDNGTYYDQRQRRPPNAQATDRRIQQALVDRTDQLLAGRLNPAAVTPQDR